MKKVIYAIFIIIILMLFGNIRVYSKEINSSIDGYSVTINGNGASVSHSVLRCASDNCTVTLPKPLRNGYIIDGYSKSKYSHKVDYKVNQKINVKNNMILYVVSHKNITVTYNANHSKLTFYAQKCSIYNKETSCIVKTPKIIRNGYESLGFSSDIYAYEGEVKENQNINVYRNMTYHAITRIKADGILEGCTGYMAVKSNLYQNANTKKTIKKIASGTPFTIINQKGDYWYIDLGDIKGYIMHKYAMINLSDYIPSIIYNITNASSSIYVSSGYEIDNVTGEKLYQAGKVYNERLRKDEYIVPVMYSFANKILKAQTTLLDDGYTLKIYDSYRPYSVTKKIYNELSILYNSNKIVRKNINKSITNNSSWGQSWFLAKNLSTHNTGSAIDVTLAYSDTKEEVEMPTAMHELSSKAVKYQSASSTTYSKEVKKNPAAIKLDKVMTKSGMQTLKSEWWHFQENSSYQRIKNLSSKGCNFQPTIVLSY